MEEPKQRKKRQAFEKKKTKQNIYSSKHTRIQSKNSETSKKNTNRYPTKEY